MFLVEKNKILVTTAPKINTVACKKQKTKISTKKMMMMANMLAGKFAENPQK